MFDKGLCSAAIVEARRQRSWDLWMGLHKEKPVQELTEAQTYGDLPDTLQAFCEQQASIEMTDKPVRSRGGVKLE